MHLRGRFKINGYVSTLETTANAIRFPNGPAWNSALYWDNIFAVFAMILRPSDRDAMEGRKHFLNIGIKDNV